MRAVLLLVLVLLAAGCAAPGPNASDPTTFPTPTPFAGDPLVQDHDHTDRSLHNGSHNIRFVARALPWGNGSAFGEGGVNEFAISGNLVYVSRSNPEGGFGVVDLSDPTRPKVIGDFRSEGGADIEVSADGKIVLLMTQRTTPGPQTLDHTFNRAPRGIDVVDVSDPAHPKLSSFFPLPTNGPHTAFYYRDRDGREIVAIETYDLLNDPTSGAIAGANPGTQRVYLAQLVRDVLGARLDVKGVYEVTETPQQNQIIFPHDAFIERHPLTGKLLLTVAYWDAGIRIVDISDLAQPKEIAAYRDFAPSKLAQMHDAKTFPELLGGKHVTAGAPEIVTAPEHGQITFVDTTDPSAPKKLGYWTLPGETVVDQPFIFSPHVFDTDARGHVVIGHYHAGVWLIDAHDPTNATTLGYYLPHEERPNYTGPQPSVWGARFFGTYILATDSATGLYVLKAEPGVMTGAPVGLVAPTPTVTTSTPGAPLAAPESFATR